MKNYYKRSLLQVVKLFSLLLAAGSFQNVNAQCAANFGYTVNAGGAVDFVSTSTGTATGTSYQWDFGDTYHAYSAATSHTYGANGNYVVGLTITVISTGTCVNTYTQVVNVTTSACSGSMTASFTSTAGAGGSVGFTSTSTGTTGTTSYIWLFGDGYNSSVMNPTHTYGSNNLWQVKLIITDGACIDSVQQIVNVTTAPCSLSPSFTYTSGTNGFVSFSSTSTGTVAGTTYTWNYGDATPAGSGPNPSHTYLTNGVYTITLTASNTSYTIAPCNSTITQTLAVTNTTCTINAGFNYTVNAGGNVSYVSTSTGTTGATTYSWDFGDGHTASTAAASNTYGNGGVHNVILTVTDGTASCTDTAHIQVNVNTIPCTANSNFTMTNVAPLVWDVVPAYYGNISGASWSWGDGYYSSGVFASHTYSTAGVYNICFNIATSCGTSTTCTNYSIYKMSAAEAANSPLAMITVNVVRPAVVAGISNPEQAQAGLALFPNPSSGEFNFSMTGVMAKQVKIEVINMLGQNVFERTLSVNDGTAETRLDLSHLAGGAYSVKVTTEYSAHTLKAVVNK